MRDVFTTWRRTDQSNVPHTQRSALTRIARAGFDGVLLRRRSGFAPVWAARRIAIGISVVAMLTLQAGAHAQSSTMDQNHGLFGLDRFDENEAHGI